MARSATIGELVYKIDAQTGSFDRAIRRTTEKVGAFSRQLKGLAAAYISLRTLQVGGRLFLETAREIDALAKSAKTLRVEMEELKGLRLAASLTGGDAGQMDTLLKKFAVRISEAANNTGEAREVFRELGLDATKMEHDVYEAFLATAEQVSDYGTAADQARIATKLLEEQGVNLVEMLREGGGGLDEYRRMIEEIAPLSKKQAEATEAFSDELELLKTRASGLKQTFVADVAPFATGMVDMFDDLLRRGKGVQDFLLLRGGPRPGAQFERDREERERRKLREEFQAGAQAEDDAEKKKQINLQAEFDFRKQIAATNKKAIADLQAEIKFQEELLQLKREQAAEDLEGLQAPTRLPELGGQRGSREEFYARRQMEIQRREMQLEAQRHRERKAIMQRMADDEKTANEKIEGLLRELVRAQKGNEGVR